LKLLTNKKFKIIVDYLNIYTILYLIIHRYSTVKVLYRHTFLNSVYVFILECLSIEIIESYIMADSSKSASVYLSTTKEKNKILKYSFRSKDLVSDFLYKKFYFDNVHAIVELKFILQNESFNKILINYPDYISKLSVSDNFYSKFSYYNLPSFAFKGDKKYQYRNLYFRRNINFYTGILIFVKSIFNIRVSKRPMIGADVLVCIRSSDSLNSEGYINGTYFFEKKSVDYMVLDPENMLIYKKNQVRHLYSLNMVEIFQYIKAVIKLYKDFSKEREVCIRLFLFLIKNSKDIFFLDRLIFQSQISVIFTMYEGSNAVEILNLIGYKSEQITSVSASWSVGDFLCSSLNSSFKDCDVFFAWGKWQKKQGTHCDGLYRSIVITGYIGDFLCDEMKKSTEVIVSNNKYCRGKIISVYDEQARVDGHTTYLGLNNFYKGLFLFLCNNQQYSCIIKSKKRGIYSYLDIDIANKLRSLGGRIIYQNKHGDLGPALISNVVYAFSMNSLGNLASVWGKKVFLYDENDIIDKNILSKNTVVVSSPLEFLNGACSVAKFSTSKDTDSEIDPFVDGCAQDRIVNYINTLLMSKKRRKVDKIRDANFIYKSKYGERMVINNVESVIRY